MGITKIKVNGDDIEVQHNWLGKETIVFNGQTVSQKYSFAGTDHYFSTFRKGKDIPYILTTKTSSKNRLLNENEILIDLRIDGELIHKNLLISFGDKKKKEKNKSKVDGVKFLAEYQISDAISAFKKSLEFDKSDPEIYFYLACCYSIEEKTTEGLECLKKSLQLNFIDKDLINSHDMLAFLRTQDNFKSIFND